MTRSEAASKFAQAFSVSGCYACAVLLAAPATQTSREPCRINGFADLAEELSHAMDAK
jgi:hypothetical protein